ncbi:MAG: EamA family transporter [Moraxellaceae bacterium]|nr:EamA family transporter [Moraxellaceae bacterium]
MAWTHASGALRADVAGCDNRGMSALALSLVLAAALIHASWNLIAKKSGGDTRFALITGLTNALVWAPAGAWFGWQELGGYGVTQWLLILASAVLHTLYFVTLLRGYRHGDLTVVYPLARGSAPLVTAMCATLFMGEVLGLGGWLGLSGIVAGIVLIAGGPAMLRSLFAAAPLHDGEAARVQRERLRAGVGYGLLTGLFIAGYSVIDGYAVKHAGMSPVALDYFGNLARLPMVLLLVIAVGGMAAVPDRAYLKQVWKPALLIGAVAPVGYVMVLYAVQIAPLSRVAPAREVSMLFAALMGGVLLGERDRAARLCGAACIAAGVVALAWQ